MKLATLNDGTRDGKLVVVSKDLTRYCAADNIAPTLQHALGTYERETGEELDLRLDLTRPPSLPPEAPEAERRLHSTLRMLVDQFHNHPAVAQSGIKVLSLTAMDSDADGRVALNVKYEYPG